MDKQSFDFRFGSVAPNLEAQIKAASFLDSDDMHTVRITPAQADVLARKEDGLAHGEVISSLAGNDLPDMFDMPERLRQAGVIDWSIKELESEIYRFKDYDVNDIYNEPDTANNREIEDYAQKIFTAETVANTLSELIEQSENIYQPGETEYEEDKKGRKRFVLRVVKDYVAVNPSASFDTDDTGWLKHTAHFIEYYKDKTIEETVHLTEMIKELRTGLLNGLETPALVQGLGRKNVDALKPHFANQPIVIADPLVTLLKMGTDSEDVLGWFEGSNRRCYLDPLSIQATVASRKGNEQSLRAQLAKTMAHELVHAASSMVYRLDEGSESKNAIKVGNQWPRFFYEGMTEKIAYFIAYNTDKNAFKKAKHFEGGTLNYENIFRLEGTDDPEEILAPSYVKAARMTNPSSYIDYRLIIDTIMDKADWSAAEVTRAKADRLAVSAFLGRDSDIHTQGAGHRKTFMQALHTATTPGILNQLDQIVSYGGTMAALDVLESPNYDITSDDLLHLVSSKRRVWTTNTSHLVEKSKERQHQMQELGAPEAILENNAEVLARNEERSADEKLIIGAMQSYLKILKNDFGIRRRKRATPQERLMATLFNEKIPKPPFVFPEDDTTQEDIDMLATWLVRKRETPRYWKDKN